MKVYGIGKTTVIAGVFLFASASAVAQTPEKPRGVLLTFGGHGGTAARRAVVSESLRHLDLIPLAEVSRAAENLGASLDTPEGLQRLARELGLTLFVGGRVEGRGRQARTHLQVLGPDGDALASAETRSPVGARNQRAIARTLGELIVVALKELDRRQAERAAAVQVAHRQRSVSAPTEAPPPITKTAVVDTGRPSFLQIASGVVAGRRRLEVNLRDAGPRRYDSRAYPELFLAVEAYPLRSLEGALRRLRVGVRVARSVGLSATVRGTDEDFDATFWKVWLRAGLPFEVARLGSAITLLLGPDAGAGYEHLALEGNPVLPSATYPSLRLGGVAELRVDRPWGFARSASVRFDTGLRIPLSVGDLAESFGDGASALAVDVGLIAQVETPMGLLFGLDGRFVRYWLDFAGTAADAVGTDGSDQSVQGGAFVGWAFR